jgi:hypothetical protein
MTAMTTTPSPSPQPQSATIYQFPPRGRFAVANRGAEVASQPNVGVALGSAWYHDDAIADAERARTNLI